MRQEEPGRGCKVGPGKVELREGDMGCVSPQMGNPVWELPGMIEEQKGWGAGRVGVRGVGM